MTRDRKKVLMIGYGAVGQCALPLLLKELNLPCRDVTVLDFEDRRGIMQEWAARGVKFVQNRVTRDNLGRLLGKYLGPGDLLVDLAWNIDCCDILQWCHTHGVLYINTSVEVWNPYGNAANRKPTERTLYWRHMNIRRMTDSWRRRGPTAVLEHGANPGLISHWTRRGLLDIAARSLAEHKLAPKAAEKIAHYAQKRIFNKLAWKLGVKVIHCSERDTQITNQAKQVDEFVNTWSIEGFREEGTTTVEIGWGTHEKKHPARTHTQKSGPKNQICLARMGINTWVRSWVPHYSIKGMVIRHGEAFTISDHLTVWKNGEAIYRPTVHYAYCPCDSAIASLQELRACNYQLQARHRVMNNEISGGADILGALLMGHPYTAWWTGSELSIEESRRLVPHQNATTLQVAIAVISALKWMMENPEHGVLVPDDLPHDYVLKIADPYLGRKLSIPSDWTPLKDRFDPFGKPPRAGHGGEDDVWQFRNFLVRD